MARIDDNTQYVFIPVYEEDEELQLNTRSFFGKDLKEHYLEEKLLDCLENGKKIVYKGNEYFIDIKL